MSVTYCSVGVLTLTVLTHAAMVGGGTHTASKLAFATMQTRMLAQVLPLLAFVPCVTLVTATHPRLVAHGVGDASSWADGCTKSRIKEAETVSTYIQSSQFFGVDTTLSRVMNVFLDWLMLENQINDVV